MGETTGGTGDTGDTPGDLPDLRSLTRETVRAQIAETAWSVFAERGFEDVTVNEVAEATGISRASFFRYFSSKEEAVFVALEAMGAEIAAALEARPPQEAPWEALRRAFDAATPNYASNPARSLARLNLTRETPSLRAHQLERQSQWRRLIGPVLARRIGLEPEDVRVEAVVGAALAALDAATERWALSDGKLDLTTLIDEAFAAITDLHLG
ncbi:MAG: TetR family transcriptional regulator [Actinobacteria bacterium]|nr:TetR family transcriptional regulator [Actinomycetota bacterium]